MTVGSKSRKFVERGVTCLPMHGLLFQWSSIIKIQACLAGTKQSSSRWNVICFLHYIAEKLLTWCKTTITRSLTWSWLQQFPHKWKVQIIKQDLVLVFTACYIQWMKCGHMNNYVLIKKNSKIRIWKCYPMSKKLEKKWAVKLWSGDNTQIEDIGINGKM